MTKDALVDHLQAELSVALDRRDEYLQQRNAARQLAYDLAQALEYWRRRTGLPQPQEKLMKVMDRALGKGGYAWPEGVAR